VATSLKIKQHRTSSSLLALYDCYQDLLAMKLVSQQVLQQLSPLASKSIYHKWPLHQYNIHKFYTLHRSIPHHTTGHLLTPQNVTRRNRLCLWRRPLRPPLPRRLPMSQRRCPDHQHPPLQCLPSTATATTTTTTKAIKSERRRESSS
jgi:hypothetical protein